ncbi:MAG: DUF1638 domain-containing protein [Rhodospirillales bacterium]
MSKTGAPSAASEKTLIVACGAIAREILAVIKLNNWTHLEVQALPAQFHNRPERIAPAMREKIEANKDKYARIVCGYADCGAGGMLDAVLEEYGIERLPGAHCYAFFAGQAAFDALAEEELGTFYLTDYLARQFEALLIKGMGLDKHPELRDAYFANYKRLVYLAQTEDPELQAKAQEAARRLGLEYEYRYTGMGPFDGVLKPLAQPKPEEARP